MYTQHAGSYQVKFFQDFTKSTQHQSFSSTGEKCASNASSTFVLNPIPWRYQHKPALTSALPPGCFSHPAVGFVFQWEQKCRLNGPIALWTSSLPMSVLNNCLPWFHLNSYTKWNKIETVQSNMWQLSQAQWSLGGGTDLLPAWSRKEIRLVPRNSLSAKREMLVHIICIVRDLCSHPCPHPNQRASVQCNLCQGYEKYCSLPHQMFLSLNKNWSPAKGSESCLLHCFLRIHTECYHHHGATLARISSLFFHNT